MKLIELKDTTNQMIKKLVDELGLDGEEYITLSKCSMVFGDIASPGKFYTAESPDLKKFLEKTNFDQKTKNYIYSEGLIVVNKDYQDMPMDVDLITTCIHEKLHANRMILAEVPYSGDDDIDDYFYDHGRFVKNSREVKHKYIDPAQEILLDSIDESRDKVDYYNKLSDEEKEDLQYANTKLEDKLISQYKIDETLVELMSIVAYQLSTNKFNGIMDIIKDINEKYDADDIHGMTNIILRHGNLDLFKWMLDPLTYQGDDIHYDYFAHYINEDDQEDVTTIIESEEIMFDDDEIDELARAIDPGRFR